MTAGRTAWREFFLKDIFIVTQRGKRLTKVNQIPGDKAYISSTALNNGIDGFIGNIEGVRTFVNCLTIANSGSVGASFYHPYEFVASDHVTHLKNDNFGPLIYLFIANQTRSLSEKYNFNRELNDPRISREKVMLPVKSDGQPDYKYMERYVEKIIRRKRLEYISYAEGILAQITYKKIESLESKKWAEFFIGDIAEISSGKRLTKADMCKGDKPFIGASDSNNGVTEFVSNTNVSEAKNVLGVNYNGSVVENFYHPYTAIFSDDVKKLTLRDVNGSQHLYLFLKNSILKQKGKYQYGYKFNEARLKRQKIMLPNTLDGVPDWEFMEQYMMNLHYKKITQYLEYLVGFTNGAYERDNHRSIVP